MSKVKSKNKVSQKALEAATKVVIPEAHKPSQIDLLKEQLIDLRLRTLNFLELQIKKQHIDPIEALDKFQAMTLLPREAALNYARGMSATPELWKRAA